MAILWLLSASSGTAIADSDAITLYGGAPFLRLLGIPPLETGLPDAIGGTTYRVTLDIVNHADRGSMANESIDLDGESYYVDIALRRRVTERLTIGLGIPIISHREGVLDNVIDGWHDIFGLSNENRRHPSNRLRIHYPDETTPVSLQQPRTGFGDLRLGSYWQPWSGRAAGGTSLGFALHAELPTGRSEWLHGNGAVDLSAGAWLDEVRLSRTRDVTLSMTAGISRPGTGDLIEARRRSLMTYAGFDLSWPAGSRWQLHIAAYRQSAGFDSDLDELGRGSLQLALAARRTLAARHNLILDVALLEDVISDSTPDFGVHIALRSGN